MSVRQGNGSTTPPQQPAWPPAVRRHGNDSAGGCLLRLWEIAGQPGPITLGVSGYCNAFATDLLERDRHELTITEGNIAVPLTANGFAAVRLMP